jgi:hypothetical protein
MALHKRLIDDILSVLYEDTGSEVSHNEECGTQILASNVATK